MNVAAYSLIVYFWYHLVAESDLLAAPRAWLREHAPAWAVYPLSCPYCWSWWVGVVLTLLAWVLTGTLELLPSILFVAPVVNLFLGRLWGVLKKVESGAGETSTPARLKGWVSVGSTGDVDRDGVVTLGAARSLSLGFDEQVGRALKDMVTAPSPAGGVRASPVTPTPSDTTSTTLPPATPSS